jgi:hypothetical protein
VVIALAAPRIRLRLPVPLQAVGQVPGLVAADVDR